MRILIGAVLALCIFALAHPPVANVADVDWLGRISLLGGAEGEAAKRKEAFAGNATGLFNAEGLGVIPLTPQIGLQLQGSYERGANASNRIGLQGGPIFGWSGGLGSGGKAGFFLADQFRIYPSSDSGSTRQVRQGNFFWLRPAVSLYDLIPDTNTDVWLSLPMSHQLKGTDGKFGDCSPCPQRLIPVSQLRAAVNWFPGATPISGKDNLELTLGVQLTGYSGIGQIHVQDGVGPVFGAAIMPWPNVEVQLFKAAIDNHNHYRVTSGVQFYFDKSNPTLKQLRRKYLEPTNLPGSVTSWFRF